VCAGSWSLLLVLNLLIQSLDSGQKPIEVGPAVQSTAGDDGADPACVGDVRKRIRVEEDGISQLARLNSPSESAMPSALAGFTVAVCQASDGVRAKLLSRLGLHLLDCPSTSVAQR
jgi:hypothetical protein